MTANVLEHRRAKAFAEALEAHRTGQPASNPGMGELLNTAQSLSAITAPGLDVEVRVTQRAQLMAAFEQAMAGGGLPTVPGQRRHRAERVGRRRRWTRRFAIGGLVAGVTVGSLAGVAAASTKALPGDTLYGMKRGLEGLRLDLANSDSERGALLLDQASTRLAEARSLVGQDNDPATLSPATVAELGAALDDMHAEAAKGRDLLRSVYRANGSLDPMRRLAAFSEGQDTHWNDLQGHLPAQLTPMAGQMDQLFGAMDQDVAPLHLDPAAGHPGAVQSADAPNGSSSSAAGDGQQPGAGTGSAAGSGASGAAGGSRPSAGGAGQSTGQGSGGAVGGQVNGLVNGLTGSLTGSGGNAAASASGTPQGAAGAPVGGAQSGAPAVGSSPSGTPQVDPGLNLPPLIPGLLPGLGLSGGNGS
ncbi:hypothetical protein P3T36_003175 [Kitasatospora sp. MAP12-15]|uniref:DUF5667 domain-containing protein n=1 Tax=unclassified Kitasatospora TaxID=2633591 RepID=UPI0024735F31|nr:DUF5667 domain-containing protein [Kitasatospora sp. MAP12-44]MDH6111151.1 hypothetical protein [Kitasatospora sp. MAP12-44]